MSSLPISQLPEVTAVTTNSEFVVVENGITSRVKTPNINSGTVYGSFYSELDQTITGTTSEAYNMLTESSAYSQGITAVDDSKFTTDTSGLFNVIFSAQFNRSSGTESSLITIWLRKNGIDEFYSAGQITAGVAEATAKQLPSWNFMIYLEAGEYVELMWKSTNPNTYIHAIPPQVSPDVPGVPSVAITIFLV
jgi:hypothetical protein